MHSQRQHSGQMPQASASASAPATQQADGGPVASGLGLDLDVAGTRVRFPFDAYKCQADFMAQLISALDKSQNALLESPTGTGKTLCLLCATLAWREKNHSPAESAATAVISALNSQRFEGSLASKVVNVGPPRIFYASRTHAQLSQVVKEFRRTNYRAKTAVVGSREQLCIHEEVRQLTGQTQRNVCRQKIAKSECRYYQPNSELGSSAAAMDIEDLAKAGTSLKVCPFYTSRTALKDADLVFLPYNYLIDQKLRKQLNLDMENTIVIFDEAHNLETACNDAASVDFTLEDLEKSINELRRCHELILSNKVPPPPPAPPPPPLSTAPQPSTHQFHGRKQGQQQPFWNFQMAAQKSLFSTSAVSNTSVLPTPEIGDVAALRSSLDNLRNKVNNLTVSPTKHTRVEPGAYLFQLFGECGFSANSIDKYITTMEQGASLLVYNASTSTNQANSGYRNAGGNSSNSSGQGGTSIQSRYAGSLARLASIFATIFRDEFRTEMAYNTQFFRLHIRQTVGSETAMQPQNFFEQPQHQYQSQKNRKIEIGFWCFDPGFVLRDLKRNFVRSFILASGTLSPLPSYAAQLGLWFPHQIENPHVVKSHQVLLSVITTGPGKQILSSAYQSRSNPAYLTSLGNAVAEILRGVPAGVLVFFSSYAAMDVALSHWRATQGGSIMRAISSAKHVIVEPRTRAALAGAMAEYAAHTTAPNGVVLFAVCRGRISEGMDFRDDRARAVIAIGLPYPSLYDAKVELMRAYLDDAEQHRHHQQSRHSDTKGSVQLSGQTWYAQQAARAINQAIGRVIRHIDDYGAIFLLDVRFAEPRFTSLLSRWIRPFVSVASDFASVPEQIAAFFSTNRVVKAAPAALPAPKSSTGLVGKRKLTDMRSEQTQVFAAASRLAPLRHSLMSKYGLSAQLALAPSATPLATPSATDQDKESKRQRLNLLEACSGTTGQGDTLANGPGSMLANMPARRRPGQPLVAAGSSVRGATTLVDASRRQEVAAEYRQLVRRTLQTRQTGDSDDGRFQRILWRFRDGETGAPEMLEQVLELFAPVATRALLCGFRVFVPHEYRAKWEDMIRPLLANLKDK